MPLVIAQQCADLRYVARRVVVVVWMVVVSVVVVIVVRIMVAEQVVVVRRVVMVRIVVGAGLVQVLLGVDDGFVARLDSVVRVENVLNVFRVILRMNVEGQRDHKERRALQLRIRTANAK